MSALARLGTVRAWQTVGFGSPEEPAQHQSDSDAGGPGSGFFYDTPDDGLPDRIGGDNLFEARFVCRIARSVAAMTSAADLPARALSAVRSFFRFRQVHHGLESGVARAAKVPRIEKRLPTK